MTLTDASGDSASWLTRATLEPFAYLTTIGRHTGQPHRIEIWFAVEDGRMYLLAGGCDRSDWVRNLQANANVTVELGGEMHAGAAHILQSDTLEVRRARELLVGKYQAGGSRTEWGRSSLPVDVEFLDNDTATSASRYREGISPSPRGDRTDVLEMNYRELRLSATAE